MPDHSWSLRMHPRSSHQFYTYIVEAGPAKRTKAAPARAADGGVEVVGLRATIPARFLHEQTRVWSYHAAYVAPPTAAGICPCPSDEEPSA